VNGLTPHTVEATPVIWTDPATGTTHTFRGGYYPLKFDPNFSSQAQRFAEEEALQSQRGGLFVRAMTAQGHNQNRKRSSGLPARIDLGVVTSHISDVIHDLTHRKARGKGDH
jgi:hypothetical protein